MIKHSTFYTNKGVQGVYTTKALTEHHNYLRNAFNGRTFEHAGDAKLFFIEGMPLDTPIPYISEIK